MDLDVFWLIFRLTRTKIFRDCPFSRKSNRHVNPQSSSRTSFKYPEGRKLKIQGVVTPELLAKPDMYDSDSIIVGKMVPRPVSPLVVTLVRCYSFATKLALSPSDSAFNTAVRMPPFWDEGD